MRWDDLFADLEARWESAVRGESEAELPEVVRAERASMALGARLAGCAGQLVTARIDAWTLTGRLGRIGAGWVMLGAPDGKNTVVNTAAIDSLHDLPRVQAPADPVLSRLSFGHVLRSIAKDRSAVRLALRGGTAALTGTIDGVGADCVDVAVHDLDQSRRSAHIRGSRTVPFGAVAFVAEG